MSFRLWVLASYLFAYGGLAPLLVTLPAKAPAMPAWQKALGKQGMACGSKKGLICLCDHHGKGAACCCRPAAQAQGLAFSPDPCGAKTTEALAVGSHFQPLFPQRALESALALGLPQDPAATLSLPLRSSAPDKVPLA